MEILSTWGHHALQYSLERKRREKCLACGAQAGEQLTFFQMTSDPARDTDSPHLHVRRCQDESEPSGNRICTDEETEAPGEGLATDTWPTHGPVETLTLSQEGLGTEAEKNAYKNPGGVSCKCQCATGSDHRIFIFLFIPFLLLWKMSFSPKASAWSSGRGGQIFWIGLLSPSSPASPSPPCLYFLLNMEN